MERKHIETIVCVGYTWMIYEIGESVYWEGKIVDTGQQFLFHSLNGLREFIRESERLTNINSLFKRYVNLGEALQKWYSD